MTATRSAPGETEPIHAKDDLAGQKDKDNQENDPAAAAAARTTASKSETRLQEIKEGIEQKEFEQTL